MNETTVIRTDVGTPTVESETETSIEGFLPVTINKENPIDVPWSVKLTDDGWKVFLGSGITDPMLRKELVGSILSLLPES
jgi:hypothetical protein